MVIHTLAGEFDIYKEENGESVPVTCDDASNGFLKPKAGEWRGDVPKGHLVPRVTRCLRGCSGCRRSPPRVGVPWGHHPAGCGVLVATGWHCGAVPERGGDGWLCPAATSPTLHPVQSPQNRFCILTVAPDTLPAIATMLIDVLFYSHRWVTRVGTSSAAVPQPCVTPLHLAPCGFPSSGCVFAKCCCSLEHATRGCCVSRCHSWELEPPQSRCHRAGGQATYCSKAKGGGSEVAEMCRSRAREHFGNSLMGPSPPESPRCSGNAPKPTLLASH